MGIQWTSDYFDRLKRLHDWNLPSHGGIYVIVYIHGLRGNRKQEILYVGETKDFSDRVTKNHERYDCWVENSHGMTLCVSTHMDNDGDSRKRKELELIRSLTKPPPCNELV